MKTIKQANRVVPTTEFEYVDFGYERFNPVQSSIYPFFDKDVNIVVASHTSTGKTDVATAVIAVSLRAGKKCLYMSPAKALADEKFKYWSDLFSDYKVGIHTGDYNARARDIFDDDLVILTTEMFDSQSRKAKSLKHIRTVGCAVIDEVHILREENRGHKVEVALMRLCECQPKVRLVLLSATVSNGKDLSRWVEGINDHKTVFYYSTWRPVRLQRKYAMYSTMDDMKGKIVGLIRKNLNEKILAFVHSKDFGYKLRGHLLACGIMTDFHNASVPKSKRHELEKAFMTERGGLNVLIATSTLAMGVNLPASLVIICGVTRGKSLMVKPSEIEQEVGRCGRIFAAKMEQYVRDHRDRSRSVVEEEYRRKIKGAVYIFIPQKNFGSYKARLEHPSSFKVDSALPDKYALAFHIVAEMSRNRIRCFDDLADWYNKTFAWFQGKIPSLGNVLTELVKKKAIEIDGKSLRLRNLGEIASRFYFNPFDVYSLLLNFHTVFQGKHVDDASLGWALSNFHANRGTVNRSESEAIGDYSSALANRHTHKYNRGSEKIGAIFFHRMTGRGNSGLSSVEAVVMSDVGRLFNVLKVLVDQCTGWDRRFFEKLEVRVQYGVSWSEAELCSVKGIGREKARALSELGYKTFEDVVADSDNAALNVPGIRRVVSDYEKQKQRK